ncbi:hypothetical protein [Nitrosopumilus sp.]|uniref:hypothetical protein n=1 Tax=Nitrosopumilus sp. TaxID=2024843 RepID=UPI003B5CBE44
MAKFKKKKSKPTPDSEDSKKESVKEESIDIVPETEKTEPVSENSSTDPPMNPAEKSDKDKKLNKLFWLRVGLAVIAGIAATFIFEGIEGEDRRWASIAFMIVIFAGTIVVAKGMKMQLPSSDRKKIVTQGIGSYVFMYLFMWILSYTLVNVGSGTTGIPSPIS